MLLLSVSYHELPLHSQTIPMPHHVPRGHVTMMLQAYLISEFTCLRLATCHLPSLTLNITMSNDCKLLNAAMVQK